MAGTWDLNACPSPSSAAQQAAAAPSLGTPSFSNPAHPPRQALSVWHQEGSSHLIPHEGLS